MPGDTFRSAISDYRRQKPVMGTNFLF